MKEIFYSFNKFLRGQVTLQYNILKYHVLHYSNDQIHVNNESRE